MQRSALSHALRSAGRPAALSILTTVWMEAFARDAHLPTPATQAANLDTAKTHFDTNHCTTVLWSTGTPERFVELLVATLRRSLGIFPNEVSP